MATTAVKRVVITGSSGHCGRAIAEAIRQTFPEATVIGMDVVETPTNAIDQFEQCDVTSPELVSDIRRMMPDTIIHMAFVVNPIRNKVRMRQVNVDGTRNVLEAAARCGASRVVVGSSATAYGAFSENPVPISEEYPVRPRTEYQYAADKFEVEQLVSRFSKEHSEIATSWTRPCMIYGPGLSNYLTQFILNGPLIVLPGGNNTQMQFVHLQDVAAATCCLVSNNARGPFNVAPPDWFTLNDLARLSGRVAIKAPLTGCLIFTTVWWGLRLPVFCFPSGLWYFIRYPWVISPDRITSELGYQFKHSSNEVIRMLLKDGGRLKVTN